MDILLLIFFIVVGLVYCCKLLKERQQIIALNIKTKEENEQLDAKNQELRRKYWQAEQKYQNATYELKEISKTIMSQTNILNSLKQTAEDLMQNAEERADEFYRDKLKENEARLEKHYSYIAADKQKELSALDEQLEKSRQSIQDLEAKQLAYIKAQQRQEEINQQQDYYRLVISEIEQNDIKLLRDLQFKFSKKESIDKLIWEVYYKPAYDNLMSRLFTTSNKVCGIYRITDLVSGQSYIGQSVDIKERFRQHIKTSLSYGNSTNKLYQYMKRSGQSNFIFEILEETTKDKLNERETYWINFYKTKDFGLNSTKGGS